MEKILQAKLCKWNEKSTSSPDGQTQEWHQRYSKPHDRIMNVIWTRSMFYPAFIRSPAKRQGDEKLVYRLIQLFSSTEIFSKRRKICTCWRKTRVNVRAQSSTVWWKWCDKTYGTMWLVFVISPYIAHAWIINVHVLEYSWMLQVYITYGMHLIHSQIVYATIAYSRLQSYKIVSPWRSAKTASPCHLSLLGIGLRSFGYIVTTFFCIY